jgi:hypothetical protein
MASLRGARNPHVLQYIPVAVLRAPCPTTARYGASTLSAALRKQKVKMGGKVPPIFIAHVSTA